MPRPKEFAPQRALEQAMVCFWRDGYSNTSTQDLMSAMSIGKRSLYDTFGPKRTLYLSALREYIRRADQAQQYAVDPGLVASPCDALRALLKARIDLSDDSPSGCFAVCAAAEIAPSDGQVSDLVNAYFDRSVSLIRYVLSQPDVTMRPDAARFADAVHDAWTGMRVRLRAGLSAPDLARRVDEILALITVG